MTTEDSHCDDCGREKEYVNADEIPFVNVDDLVWGCPFCSDV